MEKNQPKKLFGTDGIRGKANVYPLVPEVCVKVGKALAYYLKKTLLHKKNHRIVIGKDTRLSGYLFESALQAGILSMGCDVLLVGPMPTPAIAQLIKSLNADAGIVISASHNPATDNGIKIFDYEGYKLSESAEEEIEHLIHSVDLEKNIVSGLKVGKAQRVEEAYGRYIEFSKYAIHSKSLSGLKVVIDCAHGAAYKLAPKIFSELGAEVIAIGNQPNGLNINENCGALHPELLCEEVIKQNANLGIALDGDADRIVVVDEKGHVIQGDKLLAVLALWLFNKKQLVKNTVVITSMTNKGIVDYLEKKGISCIETDVGDKYVIRAMHEQKLNLGGEQSGHIILHDYVTTGDGIITGLVLSQILLESKKSISNLVEDMPIWPQKLINIPVIEKKLISSLHAKKIIDEWEKKLAHNGRVNVRYSGTELVCRVMVEAKDSGTVNQASSAIVSALKIEIGKVEGK